MAAVLKYFSSDARPFHSKSTGREEAQARAASTSRTLYVGNLAFTTTDAQLAGLFGMLGPLERIVMGINKVTMKPAGFAFVIYLARASAVAALTTLDGAKLDDRPIKVEADKGFYEGRQFGRGATGAQVRDEMRSDYDEGRGGYGLGGAASGSPAGNTPQSASGGSRGGYRRNSMYEGGRGRGRGGGFRGGRRSEGGRMRMEDGEGGHDGERSGWKRRRDADAEEGGGRGHDGDRRHEEDDRAARRRDAAELDDDLPRHSAVAEDARFIDAEDAPTGDATKRRRDA